MLEFPLLATQPLLQGASSPSILPFLSSPLIMLCWALVSPSYVLLWLVLRRGLRRLDTSRMRDLNGRVLLGLHLRGLRCWDSRISSTHHPPWKHYHRIHWKPPLALLPFPFPSSFSLSPTDRILVPLHTFTTLFISGALLPPLLLHPKGLQWCP